MDAPPRSPARVRAFLHELRRRNVIRVAVGYAISAFVALQVADLLFPALGTPDWGSRWSSA